MSRVWIPNLAALPIIASVSLTHIPPLFACFHESVSCVYAFFFTCLSICVARAACFVVCPIFINTFLFSFFFSYKFHRHLCHGAYWCTCSPAHMATFLFHLHFYLSNSCVCVCQLVYALPSPSTFIYNCRHIHMYTCNTYCIMITYNLNIPIIIRLCVPASKGFAQSLHTCDSMLKGFYFNIPTCLYFLWILPSHVHIKNVELCMHLPLP